MVPATMPSAFAVYQTSVWPTHYNYVSLSQYLILHKALGPLASYFTVHSLLWTSGLCHSI